MRRCRRCGERKPIERFVKNRECRGGYGNVQAVHPYCNLAKGVRERDARKAAA